MMNSNERRLYVNTLLQKVSGSDTDFTVNLGGNFTNVLTLRLNSFICDNYFLQFSDLSIQIDGGDLVPIYVNQYITRQQLVPYLNTFTVPLGLTLTDTSNSLEQWDYRLQITGDVAFSFVGNDWFQKLGYVKSLNVPALVQTGEQTYDFGQSASILVEFVNLPNAITNSLNASFHIDNNVSFGQRLMKYFFAYNSNQSVTFSSPQTFSSLNVRLLDSEGKLLRTPNLNDNGISVVMNISCYDT